MSHAVAGLAEKLFSIDPRPSSLSIEKVISNFVLFDIALQLILIGWILIDDFVCFEKNANIPALLEHPQPTPLAVHEYYTQVCGTEIRSDAYWFYIEKILFLFFFLAIFYLNKTFVGRVNRYHVIIMKEKIPKYLTMAPVYLNVNYYARWKKTVVVFFIYKIITIFVFALLITAAMLIIHLVDDVQDLLLFDGVDCGPKMKFVKDLGVAFTCHFEHEFLIRVISYITNIIAFLILLLYIGSLVALGYYVWKFNQQRKRQKHINLEMTNYNFSDGDEEHSNAHH